MPHKPRLIILAGPNGSGKSTLAETLLEHEWGRGCRSINADQRAEELGSVEAQFSFRRHPSC